MIAVEQDHVPASVAGRGDGKQVMVDWHCFPAAENALHARMGSSHIIVVHDPLGPEMTRPVFVVCNIVAMSEKKKSDTTKISYPAGERANEARGIDQHVPFRADDQIARGAVRRLR